MFSNLIDKYFPVAVQFPLASIDWDFFLLSGIDKSTAQKFQGMSEFDPATVDSQIGWRKLTDPGD